jgi:predicted DNA-binding protein with PD1-like motif
VGGKLIHAFKVPRGSSILEYLERAIRERGLKSGVILGIGGLERVELGYYNPARGVYERVEYRAGETVLEVTSMTGNYLVKQDGSISIHIHINIASRDYVKGGHLISGVVNPFLEVFLIEADIDLSSIFTHR